MSKVTKAIKAGLKASAGIKPPRKYQAEGIKIVCPHCKNDTFESREAMLNRGSSTALNLDWLDESAAALVCTKCNMIQWFLNEPEVTK
jgi:hypothetical protein